MLYNPQGDYKKNIYSYLNQVSSLIIIDNSDSQSVLQLDELTSLPDVTYVCNGQNLGIAYALNQAANIAINKDYDYLLTMDQDSLADKDLIKNYNIFLSSIDQTEIGILAPSVQYLPEVGDEKITENKEVNTAITSGCLLNIKAYIKAGPFKEELFIDYVDFEYCLRLRKIGFKIIQIAAAKIYHQLGVLQKRKLIKSIFVTNHSPERYYYRTRNRSYVNKRYFISFPLFTLKDFLIFMNEIIKLLFYENKKLMKLKMIYWGWSDFLFCKYGKIKHNHLK